VSFQQQLEVHEQLQEASSLLSSLTSKEKEVVVNEVINITGTTKVNDLIFSASLVGFRVSNLTYFCCSVK
jgi:hypothetical protein